MNQSKRLKALALSLCLSASLFSLTACGDSAQPGGSTPPSESRQQSAGDTAAVDSIEVTTKPTKTDYFVGDTYDFTGGVITVTYKDGTTAEVPMTDSGVTFSATEATAVGNKSVTVYYGEEKASVRFTVTEQGFMVTFNYNYDGAPEAETVSISKNSAVEAPAAPTRDGYTFYNWYTDAACTTEYNFDTIVTADTTLYAQWQEDGATYHTGTLDLNYYGCKPASFACV